MNAKEVHEFTVQVSTWFYTIEICFQTLETKKFTAQARKNLGAIVVYGMYSVIHIYFSWVFINAIGI